LNIIAVKVTDETREYNNTLGGTVTKPIRRTKYLKVCWMCGSPYESFKSSERSNYIGIDKRFLLITPKIPIPIISKPEPPNIRLCHLFASFDVLIDASAGLSGS
jgi:hypothetical protein